MKKIKVKTKKSILKRLKITASGKLLRSHQLRVGHLRRNKSKNTLRRHKQPIVLSKTLIKTVKRMLGKRKK